MREDDESEYREGVVRNRPTKQQKGSFVFCGMRRVSMAPLRPLLKSLWTFDELCEDKDWSVCVCVHLLPQEVQIDKQLQPGLRVTVQLIKAQNAGTFLYQTLKFYFFLPHQ